MKATNQQMTREQLDELMVVAASMQQDAEKLGERPVAVFAYAVQLALAELQKTRQQLAAVVAENANKSRCIGFFASVIKSGEEWTSVCQHEYSEALKAPETDAYLTEVRAQGVEMFAHSMAHHLLVMEKNGEGWLIGWRSLWMTFGQKETGQWQWTFQNGDIDNDDVEITHWAPIPEEPEAQ